MTSQARPWLASNSCFRLRIHRKNLSTFRLRIHQKNRLMSATHDGTRIWKMGARDFFLLSTSAGFLTQHKRWTEQPAWFTERDAVGVAFEYAILS